VIIIAVPEKSVRQLPRGILAVTSAVVVDAGNYYPSRDGRSRGILFQFRLNIPQRPFAHERLGSL
jgi:hypothetical protein